MVHSPPQAEVQVYKPPVPQLVTFMPAGVRTAATPVPQLRLADLLEKHRGAFTYIVAELKGYSGKGRSHPLHLHPTSAKLGGGTRSPPPSATVTNKQLDELRAAGII